MKAKGKPQNQTNNSDKKISKEVSSMNVVLEKAVQLEDNKTAQLETELNSKTQQYDALNTEMQVMREMMKIINEKEDCNEFQLWFVCMFVSLSSIEHELISNLQGSYSTDLFV